MKLRFGKHDWLELESVPLDSHDELGVRTFSLAPQSLSSPIARSAASRAAVAANRVVGQIFQKSVAAYASEAQRASAGMDKIETAVFYDRGGNLRVIYREVVLRFEPNTSEAKQKAVLEEYGLEVRERNPFQPDQLIAFDPQRKYIAERMVELANKLTEMVEVAFAFPNFVSEFKRSLQGPRPVRAQWHLPVVEASRAWRTTQGEGIVIAILDDGVDVEHPNLKRNIQRKPDPSEPRDLVGRDFFVAEDAADHFDPRPKRFRAPFDQMPGNDIHGTCCAGVAAASGSNGVFGIAPKARILPVKIFHADDLATESRVANAIRYASRFADVLSCSWSGPPSPDIQFALEEAGAGRGGKGCPILCATGNDFASQVAFPARSDFVIAVGATTDQGEPANYSNRGPQVSVVAPSSGGTRGIFTTDVSTAGRGFNIGIVAAGGADGLNTNSFGGTSSATPLVAGIAALVLSANPGLGRASVRTILEQSATKIGPAASYDANGHSNDFGFGQVNASKAVAQALAAASSARISTAFGEVKKQKKKTSKKKAAGKDRAVKKSAKKTKKKTAKRKRG
jgi:subtilisin family serine protease